MPTTIDPTRLHFGPYRTPRFRYGQVVMCEVRGEVVIKRLKESRIRWPMGQRRSERSVGLVIYADLARAIRNEAGTAVCHSWGVTNQTVTKWRKGLGVEATTLGTSELRRRHALTPAVRAALKKARAKANDAEPPAKMAAAKRGKPRPPHVVAAIRAAHIGTRHTKATRRKMSEAARRRGAHPREGRWPWTKREDDLLRTLPAAEVAKLTSRTLTAVYGRRQRLGLPDGR